jgi:hypothetical protein
MPIRRAFTAGPGSYAITGYDASMTVVTPSVRRQSLRRLGLGLGLGSR